MIAFRWLVRWTEKISAQLVLTWLAVLVAGVYLVGFVVAGALRMVFPYPLEVSEDASIQVLRQILQGHPVYGPPSLQYVPIIYPPLYFSLSAGVALITGAGFLPLRLVSLVASIGAAGLIYGLVSRETTSRAMGCISAGLFVGSTVLALDTLDLARVDALGGCLLLGAVYTSRSADFQPGIAGRLSALAGLMAGLAILTKQTDAVVAVALMGYLAFWAPARLVPFSLLLCLTVGVGLLAVFAQAGDWTRVYLYELPRLHVLDEKHLANFWSDEVLPGFTLPLVLGPLFLVGRWLRGDRRSLSFYALAVVSLLGLAWGGWANRASASNVLEPAFAGLSILFGLGISEGLSLLAGRADGLRVMRGFLRAMCLAQLLLVSYDPRATVPVPSDGWASDRLVEAIGALPGTVFGPGYGEWSRRAGKGDQPAYGALMEIGGGSGDVLEAVGGRWRSDLTNALLARRYDYVLLDPTSDLFFVKGIVDQSGYVDIGPLFKPTDEFYLWRGTSGIAPDAHVYVPVERGE